MNFLQPRSVTRRNAAPHATQRPPVCKLATSTSSTRTGPRELLLVALLLMIETPLIAALGRNLAVGP